MSVNDEQHSRGSSILDDSHLIFIEHHSDSVTKQAVKIDRNNNKASGMTCEGIKQFMAIEFV